MLLAKSRLLRPSQKSNKHPRSLCRLQVLIRLLFHNLVLIRLLSQLRAQIRLLLQSLVPIQKQVHNLNQLLNMYLLWIHLIQSSTQ